MTRAGTQRFTRPDGSPVRALVVDDELNLTELLSLALAAEGWEVRSASNGQEARDAARDFGPDVVVLDVMMPGLDGLEVLRRLRAAGEDVPVCSSSRRRTGSTTGSRRSPPAATTT